MGVDDPVASLECHGAPCEVTRPSIMPSRAPDRTLGRPCPWLSQGLIRVLSMADSAAEPTRPGPAPNRRGARTTSTSSFGAGRREGHDATDFYARFSPPTISADATVHGPVPELGSGSCLLGDAADMRHLPDNSVALVVTSPPYFVGKEYELAVTAEAEHPDRRIPETYLEFLHMLRSVFAECVRVLEPGGRIAVNVANLGRKPYRSLSADVIAILQDDLGLLLRGEVIWQKGKTSSGSAPGVRSPRPPTRCCATSPNGWSSPARDASTGRCRCPSAAPRGCPTGRASPMTSSSTSPATSGRSTPSPPPVSAIPRRSPSSCPAV